MAKLQPLDDRLFVKPLNDREVKRGNLVIVDNVDKPCYGTVTAVSEDRDHHGKYLVKVDIGHVVAYPRNAGKPLHLDGETLLVLRMSEIIGFEKEIPNVDS